MSQRRGGEGAMERQGEGARGRGGEGARRKQARGLIVGTCLLSVTVGVGVVSLPAEPASVPTNAGQSMPQQPNHERFLQNFISQGLEQGASPTATPPDPPSPNSQSFPVSSQPSPPQSQPAPITWDLT